MSLNINRVTAAGNLTRDPELKQIGPDKVVAAFGIAVNRTWKNSAGEKQEEPTFIECEAWGRTAELVGQYLKKGDPAYVEGRLKQDTWDDKTDGKKRSKTKVAVDNVQFLGGKRDGPKSREEADAQPVAPKRPAAAPVGGGYGDSDPPFLPAFGGW